MSRFTTMGQVRRYIMRRLRKGVSVSLISTEIGVTKPQVKRLLVKYPGLRVARQLGVPEVCPMCGRPAKGARRIGDSVYYTKVKTKNDSIAN